MGLGLGLTAGVVALALTAVFRASVILVIVGTTAEAAGSGFRAMDSDRHMVYFGACTTVLT
jgi:hypothetical protein